jgi:hypothetical protein
MLSISDLLLPTRNHTSMGRSTPKIPRYPIWFENVYCRLQATSNKRQIIGEYQSELSADGAISYDRKVISSPDGSLLDEPRKLSALHLFLLGFFKLLFPSTYLRLFSVENVFSNSSY